MTTWLMATEHTSISEHLAHIPLGGNDFITLSWWSIAFGASGLCFTLLTVLRGGVEQASVGLFKSRVLSTILLGTYGVLDYLVNLRITTFDIARWTALSFVALSLGAEAVARHASASARAHLLANTWTLLATAAALMAAMAVLADVVFLGTAGLAH